MRWYVVHTQSQAEDRALWHLQNQGFRCFLPRIRKLRRHARKVEPGLFPLFPRYLFVNFARETTRWRTINGTRGVVSLLANGPTPLPVPRGMVENLMAQCDESGITALSAFGTFTKGLKVRITSGIFTGQAGEIVLTRGHDRVQVLLHLLGVQTPVELPSYAVEAA